MAAISPVESPEVAVEAPVFPALPTKRWQQCDSCQSKLYKKKGVEQLSPFLVLETYKQNFFTDRFHKNELC